MIAVGAMFLITTGCQDNKTDLVPDQASKVQSGIEAAVELARNAVKPGMQQQYEAMNKAYKALTFDELEAFNQEINRLSLEKELNEGKINGRSNAGFQAQLKSDYKNIEIYKNAVNQQAVKLFGVPFNKLNNDQIDKILSKVVAPAPSQSPIQRTNACSSASFPNVTSRTDNAPANHVSWTRRATPSEPNDCDYEFLYNGYRTQISADNLVSQWLCEIWNYRILRRQTSSGTQTRLLFGAGGIAATTGTALFNVNMR